MAAAVLSAVTRRLEHDGRLWPGGESRFLAPAADGGFEDRGTPLLERPPVVKLGRTTTDLRELPDVEAETV
jgi:hypothetical protein